MKKFILCFLMSMAISTIVQADPVTFEATINSPRISLDEALQLTLTVTGINQNLDPISLPTLDGFSAKYLGPSTSISIVNGDYHSEHSFIYNLFPNKIGKFQIPPISATIAGQTYTTKPIDVEVFESSAQAQQASGESSSDQNQAPSAESLKDKVLIMVSVNKNEVYLNERVPVTIKLLVNGIPVRDIQYPQFGQQGFSVDDFDKAAQSSQVIDGVRYDTVIFKTSIYPNQVGDLPIGPVQIQGNVLYKTGQNNPFGQENDFFGNGVLNNFFDSYATRPITVTSQPLVLHVSALPDENRPNDFTGAVGQFDFQASVSPQQVKAGDPLTLKMAVQGSGNYKSLKMPTFTATRFKSYAPQIKDTGSEKTAEQVIIPTSADIKEIPALHFSYFDTSLKSYKTITRGPFAIQVTAPNPDQQFKAVGFSDISKETQTPGNQFSLGKIFNQTYQFLEKLFKSVLFWVSAGFILAAGISYFLWRRFQDRLENDPAFARRLKAVREARQALEPAQEYLSVGKQKEFYALLSKALRDYLANKWHESSAALSVGEIVGRLKSVGVDEGHITQLKTILEQADLVCFAGAQRSSTNMREDLAQTQDGITHLEKILK